MALPDSFSDYDSYNVYINGKPVVKSTSYSLNGVISYEETSNDVILSDIVPQLEKLYDELKSSEPKIVWIGKAIREVSLKKTNGLDIKPPKSRIIKDNLAFNISYYGGINTYDR